MTAETVTAPLTDAPASVHTTDAAKDRIRARARANTRLKIYGLLAIGFAVGALVLLLWSVFERAWNSATEHYAVIEMTVPEAEINAENVAGTDFAGIIKGTLKERFSPSGRSERRALYGLTSDGAADDMRDAAVAGTLEFNTPLERRLLVSDDADLYLRGDFGRLQALDVSGPLTIEAEGDTLTLLASENAFSEVIGSAKAELRLQADQLRGQAARQEQGITVLRDRAAGLEGKAAEDNARQIAGFIVKRDIFTGQADALDIKITAGPEQELALSDQMPSYFVHIGDSYLKLTAASASRATAEPLLPFDQSGQIDDWKLEIMATPEAGRTRMSDYQIAVLESLRASGKITEETNLRFFSKGDSREPELAGIKGAIVGSLLTMLVTFIIAFPTGVMAAIYLEEFAPKNKFTDFIEVNINNLAAVPSIVFGLLGVGVFLWLMPDLRSTPLIGGIVLALMTLPTIVIASRAALKAVPPSIRSAALGLGASKTQTVFHHVLPLAMPGILTGSIIGMAQALGETAPLLLIGMVAFITAVPEGVTDAATVLPVQVFIWANQSESMFDYRTAAAIVVLLAFLLVMNLLAIILRKRFERRW